MAPKSKNLYFITTATTALHGVRAGQICYINEDLYSLRKDPKSDTLPVIVLGSVFDRNLPLEVLEPLTKQEAEYLLALETPKERLEEFIQSKNLKQAEDLLQGCEVRVEQNGEWLKGVVRYIGRLKEPVIDPIAGVYFGVELQGEDTGKGENDGTYQFKTFFTCQKNCGIFAPFNRINPMHTKPSCFCHATLSGLPETPIEKFSVGDRVVYFIGSEHRHGMVVKLDEEKGTVLISTVSHDGVGASAVQDSVPPVGSEDVLKVLTGRMKGIQGHCNSCYMDSQNVFFFFFWFFFYLFIFFVYLHIKTLLICLHNRYRQTFGGKVESSYFYQIFVDYNNSLVLPTVQQLLEHSFYNSGLRLAEVPSCLILTMPRSGKKFKMFSKIIPSLELDITALLSNGPQQCVVCGQLAHVECTECFGDPVFSSTGFKLFCDTCSAQVHLHPCRQFHKPTTLGLPEGFLSAHIPREKLELFAVLCIETSHYVSFVKHGPKTADWIFFDSMADRMGDQDGYNVPQVKECPEVVRYLTMPLAELAAQVPREMEGVAKRLFCDGYMYMYRSPNMALYR
uniref:ubiquitinyl hydrolase 1 n=1 Tax=Pygocentrus nattereri TaxID=42514 RepID=A0AAR2L2H5_PYGNA